MLISAQMTTLESIVEAAKELSDDEKRLAADRILRLVPSHDPALEASLARGVEDIRAGRVSDFGEFLEELEAEDRAEASA